MIGATGRVAARVIVESGRMGRGGKEMRILRKGDILAVLLVGLVSIMPTACAQSRTGALARPSPSAEDLIPPEEVEAAERVAHRFCDMLAGGDNENATLLLGSDACPGASAAVDKWDPLVDGEPGIVPPGAMVSTINADLVIYPTNLRYPPSIVVTFRLDGEQEWMVSGLTFGCAFDPR